MKSIISKIRQGWKRLCTAATLSWKAASHKVRALWSQHIQRRPVRAAIAGVKSRWYAFWARRA